MLYVKFSGSDVRFFVPAAAISALYFSGKVLEYWRHADVQAALRSEVILECASVNTCALRSSCNARQAVASAAAAHVCTELNFYF